MRLEHKIGLAAADPLQKPQVARPALGEEQAVELPAALPPDHQSGEFLEIDAAITVDIGHRDHAHELVICKAAPERA